MEVIREDSLNSESISEDKIQPGSPSRRKICSKDCFISKVAIALKKMPDEKSNHPSPQDLKKSTL